MNYIYLLIFAIFVGVIYYIFFRETFEGFGYGYRKWRPYFHYRRYQNYPNYYNYYNYYPYQGLYQRLPWYYYVNPYYWF